MSSRTVKTAFSPAAVDWIKNMLKRLISKGSPISYEISVDGETAIEKTSDPEKFDDYMDFLSKDTRQIRVLIHERGDSSLEDQYIFTMKMDEEKSQNKELSGTEISTMIEEKLKTERQKWDMDQLRKEYGELANKNKQAEEYIDKLEEMLQDERSQKPEQKSALSGLNIGELASVALEGLIRRNTKLISKLPGGDALAGAIKEDSREKEQESEASFKKKQPEATALSEEDKKNLAVLNVMKTAFDENQLRKVSGILEELSANPDLIPTVLDLVQPEEKQSENS